METLIISAIYRGNYDAFENGEKYYLILSKEDKGWQIMTIDNGRQIHHYPSLLEFIKDWSNISTI